MKDENELLKQIEKIVYNFANFEKPIIKNNGDILIKNITNIKLEKKDSILTNVFKQMIANDIKKNRV
ncbi:MAG: hypothetical protein ACKVIT_08745 [Candidatus Puniceispirillales bacterium]|jgi:hypothetical protein|tara:strand:+ start:465 stop:665 length:201 start_codon:yes stop_codon:yes gene_type:complete